VRVKLWCKRRIWERKSCSRSRNIFHSCAWMIRRTRNIHILINALLSIRLVASFSFITRELSQTRLLSSLWNSAILRQYKQCSMWSTISKNYAFEAGLEWFKSID